MSRRFIALPKTLLAGANVSLRCPNCGEMSPVTRLLGTAMVCPWCDWHFPWEAGLRLDALVDAGSFRPLPARPTGPACMGWATVGGRSLAIAMANPGTGWAAADSMALVALAEEAQLHRYPLLWVVTDLGEDVPSAVSWPGVAAALDRLRKSGLPWLVLFSGPCIGPMAAVGLQADLVLAEPGTEVGLLPSQELRQAGSPTSGSPRSPQGLLRAGWADAVVPRLEQRATLAWLLDLFGAEESQSIHVSAPTFKSGPLPRALDLLAGQFSSFLELHGDRQGEDDPAVAAGLARLKPDGTRLLILAVAHVQGGTEAPRRSEAVGAGGWLKATRLLRLAGRLSVPVVVLVGRPRLRAGRRERPARLAFALGEMLQTLLALPVPVLSIRLDGNSSLPAMVLTAADRILTTAPALQGLQAEGLVPDGIFAGIEELKDLLPQQLQELARTYTGPGPLGRRQLLQRRHSRWAHLFPRGDNPLSSSYPQGRGADED